MCLFMRKHKWYIVNKPGMDKLYMCFVTTIYANQNMNISKIQSGFEITRIINNVNLLEMYTETHINRIYRN